MRKLRAGTNFIVICRSIPERAHTVSLVTRLAAPPAPKTTQTILDRWVDGLDPEDRQAVKAALVDPAWRHIDLLRTLVDEGMPEVADTTFGTWRRRNGYTK